MAKQEYELRGWIKGKPFGDGKQGHTSLARREGDLEDAWPYVLKRLKMQTNQAARRRMHIEVATLETLEHPGIVRLVDSNASEFAKDVDLFLVTERVNGQDIEAIVTQAGPLRVMEAVEVVASLLTTFEFVHSRGVIHRDIKPCHVILNGGQRIHPVLIDFGFSFNEDVDSNCATESHVIVGNRFIGMPEQQVGSSAKRDSRSDLTQCVGLLFFLLTGRVPGFIRDVDSRKPHERTDLSKSVVDLGSVECSRLSRIFDIGFEFDPRYRWQSASALKGELLALSSSATGPVKFETRLADVHARIAKLPMWNDEERFVVLDRELTRRCEEVGRMAHKQFCPAVTVIPSASAGLTRLPESYPLILGFTISVASKCQQIHLNHTCHPVGAELVLRRNECLAKAGFFDPHQHSTEVIRVGLFDPEATNRIMRVVEDSLLATISGLFDPGS